MNSNLNEEIITELLKVKEDGNLYHRESQTLEFKESFNFAGLADYLRDFAAFANNKGGYIVFGVKDRPNRELIGLRERSFEQFDKLDPERITGFILDIFSSDIKWAHDVFSVNNFDFGVFYVYEAKTKPIICKKDEGKDQALKNGDIYYRYGGRTQKIQFAELEDIITKRINQNNSSWMDLMSKIAKAGPGNAAILDTEKGLIEKDESQILVVDEDLIKDIQWIKEGDFSEKKGERTLKLVGKVQPINSVEVVKKVRENKYKEYPLSATELADEVKRRDSNISQSRIWSIIKENDLKNNKLYSDYVFRNKKQESEYENNGIIPKGIPSIYKTTAIDFILKVYRNEQE
jgi:Schlafen, AlbA_2